MWLIEIIKLSLSLINRKGYFQEQPSLSHMIRVRCINPDCEAPDKIFMFDERSVGAIGLAEPDDKESEDFIIQCPFCGWQYKVPLLKKRDEELSYGVRAGIIKRSPPEDHGSSFVDVAF